MMTSKTTEKVNPKYERAEKELKKLRNAYTDIGIHEGAIGKDGEELVIRAAVNELGSSKTPSRPYMRSWFDGELKRIKAFSERLLGKVADGRMSADDALKRLGKFGVNGIRDSIQLFNAPPNAPSTVKKKGHNDPLIDTRELLNNIKSKETIKRR